LKKYAFVFTGEQPDRSDTKIRLHMHTLLILKYMKTGNGNQAKH
jgi:hypothetical protein